MKKLRGLKQIDRRFNRWLKKYGFTCRVRGVDTDFFYYHNDDTIGYSFFYPEASIKPWAKVLNELGCNYTIDTFYTAFLHECFHSETFHTMSEEAIDESDMMKKLMEEEPGSFADIYDTYFRLPVEIEATAAAVNYINTYPERVYELVKSVGKAVRRFYKIHKVVNEEMFA